MSTDLDAIRENTKGLVFISDGSRGADKVAAAISALTPLIAEVERLRAQVFRPVEEMVPCAKCGSPMSVHSQCGQCGRIDYSHSCPACRGEE